MRALPGRGRSLLRVYTLAVATQLQLGDGTEETPVPAMPQSDYFEEYGTIFDHVGMLRDRQRMSAYHDAIKQNAEAHFRGKVVLDIGTGTGVLAIWAAQAGAKAVYAVEATGVARHAQTMVTAHGLQDVVTVLRTTAEELVLPEKVDVIVSEWMGYFLLRESMVQSVLFARDKWLKPGGRMYPATARLMLQQLEDPKFMQAHEADVTSVMDEWSTLGEELSADYAIDFTALTEAYAREQFEWLYRSGWQGGVPSRVIRGEPTPLLEVDMASVTFDQLFNWSKAISLPQASAETPLSGLCVWFDVNFCSPDDLTKVTATVDSTGETTDVQGGACVTLSTSPHEPPTHWGATALFLSPPLVSASLTIGLTQSLANHHNLNVSLAYEGAAQETGAVPPTVSVSAFYSISAEIKGYELMPPDEEDEERTAGLAAGEGDEEDEGAEE